METKTATNFWWLKSSNKASDENENIPPAIVPRLELDISSSLADFLEKEQNILNSSNTNASDVDVGSILDEINRVAAQSPLGPFEPSSKERSIEDIMKEAEQVYIESSKSFEQLSQRSKTSQNVSELNSNSESTPTPKSLSPLPLDLESDKENESYTEDFSEVSKIESMPSPQENLAMDTNLKMPELTLESKGISESESFVSTKQSINENKLIDNVGAPMQISPVDLKLNETDINYKPEVLQENKEKEEEIKLSQKIMKKLENENLDLKHQMGQLQVELLETQVNLEKTRNALSSKSAPELNSELERVLEDLKDSREINTALQLQLDTLNNSHMILKNNYDDLLSNNRALERKVMELDSSLNKYKSELVNVQVAKDKVLENEGHLNKLLEIEKLQNKSLKLQNEKDARCIQDLNRQIKEMERIIARKHPDSVSALIVAAKNDASDSNLTARKVLEDRIKILEQEAANRDAQSSKVFLDIQDKFNQMKLKYESHIEDLELHVSDLKEQLKKKNDTFDVYTQTLIEEQKVPQKDCCNIGVQTEMKPVKVVKKEKEDAHLLATIRGLQADLSNKEKVLAKMQRDLDELRKTNRRLQKEREGSLRNLSNKGEFRSYPEKLAQQARSESGSEVSLNEDELKLVKSERDKLRQQIKRLEEDYQALKNKRIHDLNALHEAHEREMANYMNSMTPLREKLEIQQGSLTTLQAQLAKVKEELALVSVERDHLNEKLSIYSLSCSDSNRSDVDQLQKKVQYWEKRYEEREHRLRAIIHGLVQKNMTNGGCDQCADRQRQLIGYKIELDQLLANLRALQ